MSEADVIAEIKKIIETTDAKSAAETGKVMGVASKQFAGKADNKMVAAIMKELLK